MLECLKSEVFEANLDLVKKGLVIYTWGNVSGIDRESGLVVIKPSGVDYEEMKPCDMVVVDLITGKTVEGRFRPSSDTQTHLELYRSFPDIGGVTHTHSVNAVAFAQAGLDIPVLGTTHADYFFGSIPCTRCLSEEEVANQYELNTGKVIVESFLSRGIDPNLVPAALVRNHGPFSWGETAKKAVFHSVVLEVLADMSMKTFALNQHANMNKYILNKHYFRKHGNTAYYGQT